MPQTPERKRDYMRDFMRRKRHSLTQDPVGVTKGEVSPSPKGELLVPGYWSRMALLDPRSNPQRHLMDYIQYVQARGYMLEEFDHPRGGKAYRLVPRTRPQVPVKANLPNDRQ